MTQPIVVGVDGSEHADRAVEWAASEAGLRHRRLHIVHAVENWPYGAPLFAPAETISLMSRVGHGVLATVAERVREQWPDLEVSTALVSDDAPHGLIEQTAGAFEVVVGHRGLGGFTGLMLGSVSLRMAARCTIPVIIVRGTADEQGEVVVGLDLRKDADAILHHAFDAAALNGASLRVMHAWRVSQTLVEAGFAPDRDKVERVEREFLDRLTAAYTPWQSKYPQVEVVPEVVRAHPVTALSDASLGARLVVVGAHTRSWTAPRLGSAAHGAIHHAHCPVAVVPCT
ncbi:universal stress protein [Actinomadura nitritigenes]|uniref:universal stress protein n=1 Tax=Actinomadura nitritigenes TaxID=134602 RepID=UPI003D8EB1A8